MKHDFPSSPRDACAASGRPQSRPRRELHELCRDPSVAIVASEFAKPTEALRLTSPPSTMVSRNLATGHDACSGIA